MANRKFQTHYAIIVSRLEADRSGCAVMTVKPTLAEALSEAFSYATFYCGARGAHVCVIEQCAACGGTGVNGYNRSRKPLRCKACRGECEVSRIAFDAKPHDECTLFRHTDRLWGDPSARISLTPSN